MRGIFVTALFGLVTVAAVASTYGAYQARTGKADYCGITDTKLFDDDPPAVVMRARVK